MKLFDAHCHVDDFPNIGKTMERAAAEGVVGMAVCIDFSKHWKNSPSFFQGLEAGSTGGPIVFQGLELSPQIYPMVGIHPWSVEGRDGSPSCPWRAEDSTPYLWETEFQGLPLSCGSLLSENTESTFAIAQVEKLLRENPGVGVGETGLDFCEKFTNRAEQEDCFTAHLDLARELNRPVTVHCVQAWGRLIEILKEHPAPRILLHAFGGSPELIPELVELNCWFSFGEAVMNSNAKRGRASAVAVPSERLLIETDSDGKPGKLLPIARTVAKLRGVPVEALVELTFFNANAFFVTI